MTTDPRAGADLTDDALQNEIELVGELVVAASASEGQLTEDEIDQALGVERGHAVSPDDKHGAGHRTAKRAHA